MCDWYCNMDSTWTFVVGVNAWYQLSMDGTMQSCGVSYSSSQEKSNHLRPIYRRYVPDHWPYTLIMQQFSSCPMACALIGGPNVDKSLTLVKWVGMLCLKAATMNPSAGNWQVIWMIVSEDSRSQVKLSCGPV